MKTLNQCLLMLLLAFVFACTTGNDAKDDSSENSDSTKTSQIIEENNTPAFENLNVEYAQYQYSSAKAKKYEIGNGSEFTIPENAFVDENGNPVNGNVEIQYRELKSAAEIILSGVDMKYEKDGKQYDFQTAGMFDMRAYSNGKPVFLAKDKEIEVIFASNVEGDYGFYYYNEDDKNWVETDYGRVEVIEQSEPPITGISFNMPKPVKLDPANDLVIEVKANYNSFPLLKQYKGVVWKYTGNQPKEEVSANLSKIWSGSDLKEIDAKNNKYLLTMTSGKKSYDFEVSPVFSPKHYAKALEQYELAKKRTELTADNTSQLKRKTSISQMGLHNYDVVHQSDRMIVSSDFKIQQNQQLLPSESMDFFLITGKDNVVVRYRHDKKTQLYFSPSSDNKIVAVLPGNRVAVMSMADFKKVATDLQARRPTDYTFNLQALDQKITSAEVLDEIIAKL